MREKLNGKVLFDEDTWTRLLSEVPKVKYIVKEIYIIYLCLL
jgi:hypothetical protein